MCRSSPWLPARVEAMPVRDTKGSHLSSRHMPERLCPASAGPQFYAGKDLYAVLGVSDHVDDNELRDAFKKLALTEHPDKGGDQDKFDEINNAYSLLADPDRREAYDDELRLARDRASLVEGGPTNPGKVEKVDRKKTAPRNGSERSKDWHKSSTEWKGEKSGATYLQTMHLAIGDAQGPLLQQDPALLLKDQNEALFEKYKLLPAGSKQKQQWVASLSGKQRQALKDLAKGHEAEQMAKAQKWLGKK